MQYTLMRCYFKHKYNAMYRTLIFDLWNHEFNTGYEIHVNLFNTSDLSILVDKYTKNWLKQTYDIILWDLIIRTLKDKINVSRETI